MQMIRELAVDSALGLSSIGEKLGWNWLTYNYGVFRIFRGIARANSPRFADAVLQAFPQITSVADVGCGSGDYAAEFLRRGMKVAACEYSPRGRRWAQSLGVEVTPFDLFDSKDRIAGAPYDLAYSIEVAEHVPEELADKFVNYLINSGKRIVLTAAPPGQGGQGHINEQPKEYWIKKFEAAGCRFDANRTSQMSRALERDGSIFYLVRNLMVFEQSNAS